MSFQSTSRSKCPLRSASTLLLPLYPAQAAVGALAAVPGVVAVAAEVKTGMQLLQLTLT